MSESSQPLPKRIQWRIEWLLQCAAESVIARLPGATAFRLGEWIGRLLWHVMPARRQNILKNLRIALAGEASLDEIRLLARQSFIRSLANLVSAVHTAHLPAKTLEQRVTVENPEVVESALAAGRGCLLLPPHMGNWEILARISNLFPKGHPQGALYRPLNNPYLDARLAAKRQSEGTRMFSKRDSLLEISKFLKSGGIIGVLADQRSGPQGVPANFFGRLTRSSPLPQLLVRRCKVPAFAISVKTLSPGQWSLRYHPVTAPGDTQAAMDAIESAMRSSIVDVFWFQDRWRCYLSASRNLSPTVWLGGGEARSLTKPHRALIWLAGSGGELILPEGWVHPDVDYELVVDPARNDHPLQHTARRVHSVPHRTSDSRLRARLRQINDASALPIDFVLGCQDAQAVRNACEAEGLLFIPLDPS